MKKKPYGKRARFAAFYRNHKKTLTVYLILRAIVVAALALSLMRLDLESAFICLLTLVLFVLPAFIERNLGIHLPDTLEIIILCFIFAAEILGELRSWYVRVNGLDTVMHTLNGFLCAAVGFSLVDIFNRNKRFQFELSPLFLAIVAFCFSMTIGVLWEFFEFGADFFFHADMQKDTVLHAIYSVSLDPTRSNQVVAVTGITDTVVNGQSLGLGGYLDIGLFDTMKDLFVNFIGAVVFSVIGFFHVRSRGKSKFARQFIPVVPATDEAAPLPAATPDDTGDPAAQ